MSPLLGSACLWREREGREEEEEEVGLREEEEEELALLLNQSQRRRIHGHNRMICLCWQGGSRFQVLGLGY